MSEHNLADETPQQPAPSEATPATDEVAGEAAPSAPAAEGPDGMQAKIDELTSDLQRLQAEYVNYKRRVDRDRDLVTEHGELEGGVKAIADNLERIVAGLGLEKFGAPGDEFDPTIHEALMHGHSAEVTTTTCDKVVQPGFRIGDRVVRPALVTVVDPEPGAGPAEE